MGQELQIPAIFQQSGMAKAFVGQVNPHDDNLADGIGQSFPVISYRGKVWALRHRGERKTITRPDDGTQSGHIDVVILGQAKSKSKSYYKKYDANTSEGDRPICASIDGIVPDNDVTAKQSDTCALCQRNVWKVDPQTGRKGRECTDYKRLAVLVAPNQSAQALGTPLVEPIFLRVPPDSLNSLAIMGDTMTNQGFHYATYWTRISFDPVKAHPSMIFRPLQPVKDEEAKVILELRNSPAVARITGGEPASSEGMQLIEPQQMAPAGTVDTGLGLTAPVTRQAAPQVEPEDTLMTNLVVPKAEPPKRRGRPVATQPTPAPVQQALPQAPPIQGNGNGHTSDEGLSEPSDDELDAEIAKLISR